MPYWFIIEVLGPYTREMEVKCLVVKWFIRLPNPFYKGNGARICLVVKWLNRISSLLYKGNGARIDIIFIPIICIICPALALHTTPLSPWRGVWGEAVDGFGARL